MRAAILTEQHQPLELAEIDPPQELRFGQARIRVHYSGLCGSQIGEIDGVKGPDPHLPHLLGHEGSGTVVEIGEGVTTVRPGDHVVMHWMRGSGHEGPTPSYRWDGREVNAGAVTTFNEEAVVAENRVTRVPGGLDPTLAPLLGCAVTTAAGVVAYNADLHLGESLVIFGVGGIGLSIVQIAALTSANPIVAIDLHPAKLALAQRLGATHVIDATDDVAASVRDALDGDADAVVDTTGFPEVIQLAYELAGPQGRTILVGVPPIGKKASLYTLPLHFGKVLTGSHGGEVRPDVEIPRLVRLHEAGKLDLASLITDRFELDAINQAIEALRSGGIVGRALIAVSTE